MQIKADANKIRRWRDDRGWSQEHLAEVAGIGLRTVQRIEKGDGASRESLMALASAFGVDVVSLTVDPNEEAERIVERKLAKGLAGLRLSFGIHLAAYVVGVVVFAGISWGLGGDGFVMKWPLIWWTVAIVAHGATLAIVELVARFNRATGSYIEG